MPTPQQQLWTGWPPPAAAQFAADWVAAAAAAAATANTQAVGSAGVCPQDTASAARNQALGGGLPLTTAATAAAVRLRGLPFSATEQDVLAFFAQHDIVDRISEEPKAVNLLLRSNGKPSGQAIVQMRGREDAELARHVLSGQWMGSRYIEVFLCGQDGTDFGGADSESAMLPPAATAAATGGAQ